jgi:hypothetical protein
MQNGFEPRRQILALASCSLALQLGDAVFDLNHRQAERNSEAECASIHVMSSDGTSKDGTPAEMTLVSTRYTVIKDRPSAASSCRAPVGPPGRSARPSATAQRTEPETIAPIP